MTPAHAPADVLVLGGGLAGAAAAIVLARAGRAVTLIEREPAPRHKVCGEFLSAEALPMLAALGVLPEQHGAHPIHAVRLCSAARVTSAPLPFAAQSLTRRCLDGLLLVESERAGVCVHRGVTVQSLERGPAGWQARLSNGAELTAPQAILATGKHDLRALPRPAGVQGDLVAFKMYWQLAPAQAAALQGHVELLLFPEGYAGLQLVEGGNANLCALLRRSRLARLGAWPGFLAAMCAANPHAADRLRGAQPLLDKPLAISSIPYGFVRRDAIAPDLWAVGDQAAVIPSFTGDGMSMALHSGLRAAHSLLAGQTAQSFQRSLAAELRPQIRRATLLSRALVARPTQPLVSAAAHLWPAVLGWAARSTRLSQAQAPGEGRV